MTISMSVPLEALEDPEVARALSTLVLSLGGLKATQPRDSQAARTEPSRPAKRRRAAASKPADRRSESERYQDFIQGLPVTSRRFVELIKSNGELRLSQAVRELALTKPKALGGITGSLTRWARQRGVELPFRAGKTADGERSWTWIRGADDGTSAIRRKRATRKRTSSDPAPSAKRPASATPEPALKPIPSPTTPDVKGREILTDARYTQLVDGMPELSREFLVLLSERRAVTISEALREFGLEHAKAINNVIRTLRSRASERQRPLPFEEDRGRTGERMWVWKGVPGTGAKPEGMPGGVKRRRRPTAKTSAAPTA